VLLFFKTLLDNPEYAFSDEHNVAESVLYPGS